MEENKYEKVLKDTIKDCDDCRKDIIDYISKESNFDKDDEQFKEAIKNLCEINNYKSLLQSIIDKAEK